MKAIVSSIMSVACMSRVPKSDRGRLKGMQAWLSELALTIMPSRARINPGKTNIIPDQTNHSTAPAATPCSTLFIVRDLTGVTQTTVRPNSRCVIEEVPQQYVWCEHCGYNRRLTDSQVRGLYAAKEMWCPECAEAISGH